ncbi:predicted protein [Plenodomus lingam JN3]|uniref:Predicted protein n=1 Tax=Leptosphaeria maculans (strain JN3 / isolate v23.1.3 / race Av1-4-5-6-7-8) TaxID=985895 RepID=E5ACB2_LEPMJ|nr:predicted protein [Plenodomus lingam JN3]CBY02114.1 predicted protein [Plenodomus lingam JN3]
MSTIYCNPHCHFLLRPSTHEIKFYTENFKVSLHVDYITAFEPQQPPARHSMSYNNETASPASGKNSAQGKNRAITDVATGALAARLPTSSHKKFDDDMSMGSCGEQDRSHAISMLTPCPNRGAVPGFDESAEVSSPSAANVSILRLHAVLGIGSPTSISIDAERVAPGANPSRPGFLKGVVFKSSNKDEWLTIALPHIATLTFTIASIANLIFAGPLFSSPELPNLYYGITKFAFPGFHWFSGVTENRARNPFLNMAANLPHIEDIALICTPPALQCRAGQRSSRWKLSASMRQDHWNARS